MLAFDLEFYVPREDRNGRGASFRANPWRPGHHLLGGVFVDADPRRLPDHGDAVHAWIWRERRGEAPALDGGRDAVADAEARVLERVLREFERAWGARDGEAVPVRGAPKDAVVMGVGIAQADLSYLMARCQAHELRPPADLYRLFHACKLVDLAQVATLLRTGHRVLYPLRADDVVKAAGVPDVGRKASGARVWGLYDEGRFPDIEARTEAEVLTSLRAYAALADRARA